MVYKIQKIDENYYRKEDLESIFDDKYRQSFYLLYWDGIKKYKFSTYNMFSPEIKKITSHIYLLGINQWIVLFFDEKILDRWTSLTNFMFSITKNKHICIVCELEIFIYCISSNKIIKNLLFENIIKDVSLDQGSIRVSFLFSDDEELFLL